MINEKNYINISGFGYYNDCYSDCAGRVVSDTDDEEEYTYYTGVKTYDTPITMCVKSEKAIIYKNLYDTAGQMEILREVKKNTKIQVTGEGKWDFDKIYFVKIG